MRMDPVIGLGPLFGRQRIQIRAVERSHQPPSELTNHRVRALRQVARGAPQGSKRSLVSIGRRRHTEQRLSDPMRRDGSVDPGDCHPDIDIAVKTPCREEGADQREKLSKVERYPRFESDQSLGSAGARPINGGRLTVEQVRASVHAEIRTRNAARIHGLTLSITRCVQAPLVGPAPLPAWGETEMRSSPSNFRKRSDSSAQFLQKRFLAAARLDGAIPKLVVTNCRMGERLKKSLPSGLGFAERGLRDAFA